jgi:hypothetical protein
MTKLFSKKDKIVMVCSIITRVFLLLGGLGAVAEGHPVLSGVFLAIGGAAMEVKDQILKNKTPGSSEG